jgi:hypothetical protein
MSTRKEASKYAKVAVKDCWHPYGLQGLSPSKFAIVATQILKGDFGLLDLKPRRIAQSDCNERLEAL